MGPVLTTLSKKTTLSLIFIATILIVIIGTLPLPELNAAEVTIDSAVNTTANSHNGSSPTVVFTSDSNGYAFYVDSDGTCKYSKTTNSGSSWGTPVTVDSQTDCLRIAVWYDRWTPGDTTGNYVHISTFDSGSDDLFYTRLDTSTDTLTTTVNTTGSNQGGTFRSQTNIHSITKGTDGDLYAGIQDGSDSFVIKCTGTCTTAANWTEAGTIPFDTTDDWLILMPLSGSDILAIRWDISADDIDSKVYDDSTNTWDTTWTDIDTNAAGNTTYDAAFGATVDKSTNDIYLTYAADISTLGTDDDIRTVTYNGSWLSKTDVLTNDTKGIVNTKIAYDENTDDVYVVYTAWTTAGSKTTGNVYWKKSTDSMSTWSSEQGPVNSSSTEIFGSNINITSNERIYVTWVDSDTNPDELYGDTIVNLVPPNPEITVGTEGTQISSTNIGINDEHIGGAFTLVRGTGNANVTQVIISETGTISANSNLDDLKLYYKQESTCSTSIPADATVFNSTGVSFDTSDKATATGTMSIGTSQVCLYVQFDIGSGATVAETIDIEISNPSADITVSAGTVATSSTVQISGSTVIDNVTIDDTPSTNADSQNGSSPNLVFVSDQNGYAFYRDSNGSCVYSKTTDGGSSWGSTVSVDSQTDCIRTAVWYDRWTPGDSTGNNIHISTMDSGNDDMYYTRLNTSTDTLTTTVNATGSNQGGIFSANQNIHSITKGTDGDLYMGVQDGGDSFVLKCSGTCSNAANWTEAGTSPFDTQNDWLILLPQLSGNVIAIRHDLSADTIDSKIYTESTDTWDTSWTTVDSNVTENATFDGQFAATLNKDNGNVYLAYVADSSTLGTNDDIRTAIYDGSWSIKTNVVTNDSKGIMDTFIAFNENVNDVYIVYTARTTPNSDTTGNVYWKKSTDGMTTWGSESSAINANTAALRGITANIMSDERIYTMWTNVTDDDILGSLIADLEPPTFEQSAYRLFNNSDSTDVGSALASQDTAITLGGTGSNFRLRLLLHTNGDGAKPDYTSFKLQYAGKGIGSCASPSGGTPASYTDVTTTTAIAFLNNSVPDDGSALTGNVNDPTHGGYTIIDQTYEEVNNFTNSVSKLIGNQDGLWDFALTDNAAPGETTYCFRIVYSDNSTLNSYDEYPEITTYSTLDVDIVDNSGSSVPSPSVSINAIQVALNYQNATGIFGTTSEKIRITNTTVNSQWSLSLAASGGQTAFWDGASIDYDFNDPTSNANDGGDADSLGGQMTIDPSSITITPKSGCSTTGLTKGSSTSFDEGILNSITLLSSDATSDINCFWDIIGINISQSIPTEQPIDIYDIDMTLTIVSI